MPGIHRIKTKIKKGTGLTGFTGLGLNCNSESVLVFNPVNPGVNTV